ncbi:hypothetical protein J3E64_000060 [Sphingobium sp. OAS761]|nr:hypothetical protein [Sphingobium sp. OAS761]MCP1468393.1 hypothetical protein [Sphingobium sp. OAS761]
MAAPGAISPAQVARFVQYYERIARLRLADLLLSPDAARRIGAVTER